MTTRPSWLVAVLMLLASACTAVPAEEATPAASGPVVRIGTGPEAESRLLADIAAELVAAEGFRPVVVERATSTVARQALELGDVDLLPGYTGQAWLEVLGRPNPPADPRTSFARVRTVEESDGILWLRPGFDVDAGIDGPPANATFGLFVRGVPSADADVRTIAQLALRLAEKPDAVVCVDEEFATRPDGWAAVARAYSIATVPTALSPDEAVQAVAAGDCLVGLSTTTDGAAWHAGLQLLADPLQVFPAFVVTVQAREELLEQHPGVEAALDPLVSQLTTRMLGTWNGQVTGGRPREQVAAAAARSLRESAGLPVEETPTG